MKIITHERLKEMLDYEPSTGVFTWKKKTNRRMVVGAIAGYAEPRGRRAGCITICIDGEAWFAHRLAWLYVHGAFPIGQIDHKNGNPADNRIANLRDVTPMGNSQNLRRQPKSGNSGLLGAAKGRRGNWQSYIKVNKKSIYLGEFKTPEEAHAAYVKAKRIHHPTCTI